MKLAVYLGTIEVARLERRGDGLVSLRFLESYLARPERPLLSVFFVDKLRRALAPTPGLPPFFANLLPEGELRALIARSAGIPPEDELGLLAHLGEDLPGAVRVAPIERAGAGRERAAPASSTPRSTSTPLRFSLAGMQLKFSMVRGDKGLILPATGTGGDWLVKLPDRRFPSVPENEFSTMTWAQRSGIEVPTFEAVTRDELQGIDARFFPEGELAFAIRRFDRPLTHIEDFAQVNGFLPAHKYDEYEADIGRRINYETLANQILAFCGERDLREFLRRLVFTALSGNGDAHLKNWSLIYRDGRTPALSPAYDQVSTLVYPEVDERLALPFLGDLRFESVNRRSMRRLAELLRLDPEVLEAQAREDAARIMESFTGAGLSSEARYRLGAHHRGMLRASESLLS